MGYETRLVKKKKTRWNASLYLLSPKILCLLNEVSLLPIAKCLKLAPAETSKIDKLFREREPLPRRKAGADY